MATLLWHEEPPNIADAIRENDLELRKAEKQHRENLRKIQEACGQQGHIWQLAQIAGEGRYCKRCDFHDWEFDD